MHSYPDGSIPPRHRVPKFLATVQETAKMGKVERQKKTCLGCAKTYTQEHAAYDCEQGHLTRKRMLGGKNEDAAIRAIREGRK